MIQFPDYSDLAKVSGQTRLYWEHEIGVRERYDRYFSGHVFDDRVPSEAPHEDAPLLYPVGLNLVKKLTTTAADWLFGEWEDEIVRFARKDDILDEPSTQACQLLSKILTASKAPTALWEIALDGNVYGGGAMKIEVDLPSPGHVKWKRIPLQSFFPIWNPDDVDDLLEVFVVVEMTQEQAKEAYGLQINDQMIIQRVEHWTKSNYENFIDQKRIDAYSGVNPWGFVPFVYIPRLRSNVWWGDAMTEDVIPMQDELNMKVADLGEGISYNSQPTRWGYNLPKGFNQDNFPLEPNAMWDLGRSIGTTPPPTVGIMQTPDPAPQGVFSYLKFLNDWASTASFAPPIVFGEDTGGGQRSGDTLEIRMLPMIKAVRRQRAYMSEGLMKAAKMTGKILEQKHPADIPLKAIQRMIDGSIMPVYADPLPRDHQSIVDEVVKLLSTVPQSISLETAVKILGRGQGEVDRIRKMLAEKELYPQPKPANNPVSEGLAGKETPQTRGAH